MKKLIDKYKILKLKLKYSNPKKLRCVAYEIENKKYLALYRTKKGKTIWSRHFLVINEIPERAVGIDLYESDKRISTKLSSK